MAELPEKLQITDDQGNRRKNGEEREAINAIIDYLAGTAEKPEVPYPAASSPAPMPPAEWSNTPKPDDIPLWTMREVPGTSLVEVWDSHGWQRMNRAYYESRYSGTEPKADSSGFWKDEGEVQ